MIRRNGYQSGTKTREHGDHVDLSSGYLGLRVAVTFGDDLGWLHERLLLWVIEPDRFVVLTPDGNMYE